MSESAAVTEQAAPEAWLRGDLGARASFLTPDVGIARAFTLPRARIEGALTRGTSTVHLVAAAVRSGGETGYVGIDGEALVPTLHAAEGIVRAPDLGLVGSAGLVQDDWTRTGDAAWGLRSLAPSLGEDLGWMDVADLGGRMSWSSARWTTSLAATTGEGARFRERNEGKDVTAYVEVRPLAGTSALVVSGLAREGSRGLGLSRDHRAGVRLTAGGDRWQAGAEGLGAWGVGSDATRTPRAASAWISGAPLEGWLAWVRLDASTEELTNADAASFVTRVGAGRSVADGARILAGGVLRDVGPAVRGVAGAGALAKSTEVFVQLDVWVDTHSDTKSSRAGHLPGATRE